MNEGPATNTRLVEKTITVPLAPAAAFELFTDGFGTWWPSEAYHIGGRPPEAVTLESEPGGRWFERDAAGVECDWGEVLVWEPPTRLVLAWRIDADWTANASIRTEVEVRFRAVATGETEVHLEHRSLESYGGRADEMHAIFDGEHGWTMLLARYRDAAG